MPLIYLRFSSSIICSARSRPAELTTGIDSGVSPLEIGTCSLDLLEVCFSEELGRVSRGEFAMMTVNRRR